MKSIKLLWHFVICVGLMLISGFLTLVYSQSYFNILPDVGGIDQQGVCRTVISDSNSIFIIGHRYDTIGLGADVKPWLGEFNYKGDILNISSLIDSLYDEPFYPDEILLTQKKGEYYYVYVPRHISGMYYTPYLFQLNIRSGKIINSILLPNNEYPDELNGQGAVKFYHDTIDLLSYVFINDSIKLYITQLDTLFKIIDIIKVPQVLKKFYPLHKEVNPDNSFDIIGDGTLKNENNDQYINNYLIKYDKNKNIAKGKECPSTNHYSFNLSDTRTVIKTEKNTWVIAANYLDDHTDSCAQCYTYIPYIYSLNEDFESVLWETQFYDISYHFGNSYELYSSASLDDGYVVSGSFRKTNYDSFPSSGVLLKVAKNGDSLWMKHYIPLEWSDDRVVWAKLISVQATPDGSIIAAGEVSDRELQIIRPWILHLDSDGCLVPGCNTVGLDDNYLKNIKSESFTIYPNPTYNELYILSNIDIDTPILIKIVSIDGKVLKSSEFKAYKDYQYILDLGEIPQGVYYVVLEDKNSDTIENHCFLHLSNSN